METLGRAFADALGLLWGMDRELIETVLLTLQVTLVALVIALLIGVPIGAAIGLTRRLPGRWLIVPLIYNEVQGIWTDLDAEMAAFKVSFSCG